MPKLVMPIIFVILLQLAESNNILTNNVGNNNNKNVLESAEELLAENGVQRPEAKQLEVVAKNVAMAEWINAESDAEWEASPQWPFAGMSEEQLMRMLGKPVREDQMQRKFDKKDEEEDSEDNDDNGNGKLNGRSKQFARRKRQTESDGNGNSSEESDKDEADFVQIDNLNLDLPEHFDIRQKWPECAGLFSRNPFQGDCGSCWSVTAASVLSDRFCIERLDVLKARIQKWMEIKWEKQQMFGKEYAVGSQKGKLKKQIHLERRKELEQEIQDAAERGDELYQHFQTKWAEMVEAKMPAKDEGGDGGMWHTLVEEWKAAMLEQFRKTAYKAEHLVSAMDLTSCTYQMFVNEWPTAQNGISGEADCAKSEKKVRKISRNKQQQTNSDGLMRWQKTVEKWLNIVAGKYNWGMNYCKYYLGVIDVPECEAPKYDGCNSGGDSLLAYLYVKEKGATNGKPYGGMEANNGCNPYPFLEGQTIPSSQHKTALECSSIQKCTNEKWKRGVQRIKVQSVHSFLPKPKTQLTRGQLEQLTMQEIMEHGSVSAGFYADLSIYFYKKGIYKAVHNRVGKKFLNFLHKCSHTVRLIGWGQTVSKKSGKVRKYWIAGNSYGQKWGQKGMFLLARGIDECGVESKVDWLMPYGFHVEKEGTSDNKN